MMMLPWDFSSDLTSVVYHYTSTVAAKAMVENRSFWLSEHSKMNDSSEFSHARGRLLDLIRQREVYIDAAPRFLIQATLNSLEKNTVMMLGSTTARKDDLSQWRSYADDGAGCVLGIDATYLANESAVAMRTVLYDESLVDHMLRSTLTMVQDQYEEAPEDNEALLEAVRYAIVSLFNIKHPGFADEREIRIARIVPRFQNGPLNDVGGNKIDGSRVQPLLVAQRVSSFGKTEYLALPLVREDGSSAIVSVGLGPTMSSEQRTQNSEFFASRGLMVWQSKLPYRVR